ncbi:MAG TPA: hypothetical protein PLM79_08755 [Syntrophobacteraceae bacterium]|nr:hypothetical protein [Syntrophobacteraceae bacterium]
MEFQGVAQWLGYFLGTLSAVVIQGEGAAYFVLMFEPISRRGKVIYDLNPAHHLDLRSIPLLFLAGWTWSKKCVVKPDYFPNSRISGALTGLAGGLAILLMSGILGTLYMFLPFGALETAIRACVVIAMANLLIPIPPFALGRALWCPFQDTLKHQKAVEWAGAIAVTALVLLEVWMKSPFLTDRIFSPASFLSRWILSG